MEGSRPDKETVNSNEQTRDDKSKSFSQQHLTASVNNLKREIDAVTVTAEDACLKNDVTFIEKQHPHFVEASQNLSQSLVNAGCETSLSDSQANEELTEIISLDETSSESGEYECRICRCAGEENLLSPCQCMGSTGWVHESCLVRWLKLSRTAQCEVCFQELVIKKQTKPLKEWKRPTGGLGPCGRVEVWYAFICLFSVGTIIGFAIFQATVKSKEPETSIIFSVMYVLCSILVLMRVKFFYQWFTKRSRFWEKWLDLNQLWTIKSADQVPQEVVVSVV